MRQERRPIVQRAVHAAFWTFLACYWLSLAYAFANLTSNFSFLPANQIGYLWQRPDLWVAQAWMTISVLGLISSGVPLWRRSKAVRLLTSISVLGLLWYLSMPVF